MPARRLGSRLPYALVLLSALVLVWALLLPLAAPAGAVEDGEAEEMAEEEDAPTPPEFEEVCGEGAPAEDFCPEPYEEPSWFRWLLRPLLIVGFFIVTALLVAYLVYQPRFARERDEEEASR